MGPFMGDEVVHGGRSKPSTLLDAYPVGTMPPVLTSKPHANMDLFSDAQSLSITPQPDRPELSRAQKVFNNLIAKIGKQRLLLAEWEAASLRYRSRRAGEWEPLQEALLQRRREWILGLERAQGFKQLGKADRRLLVDLLCEEASELAAATGDAEMKALYGRYSGEDFDAETAEMQEASRAMIEEALGVDLGDDLDYLDQQAMMERLRERLAEKEQRKKARPRSAKQQAREERARQEEQRVGQSLREVYRKLASALHPDREPDAEQRLRKTELMQRVNLAYEKKDLLALLELQLDIEQLGQGSLQTLSEERLKHFNQILKEQSQELEAEAAAHSRAVKLDLGVQMWGELTPAEVFVLLDQQLAEARALLREMETELAWMEELPALRAWLKRLRREQRFDAENID